MNVLNCNFINIKDALIAKQSSSTVFNPYADTQLVDNLEIYFDYLYKNNHKNILLIGEAPGYLGCRITGIPFTSTEVINESVMDIFKDIKKNIAKSKHEHTSSVVWKYLENKNTLPILWNAFPFHPFNERQETSNRKPTDSELKEGEFYIRELVERFKPKIIASIGRSGEKILKKMYPNKEILYIRHPSYGGEKEFIKGMDKLIS